MASGGAPMVVSDVSQLSWLSRAWATATHPQTAPATCAKDIEGVIGGCRRPPIIQNYRTADQVTVACMSLSVSDLDKLLAEVLPSDETPEGIRRVLEALHDVHLGFDLPFGGPGGELPDRL